MTTNKTKSKASADTTKTAAPETADKPVRTALEEIIVERRESVGLITDPPELGAEA